MIIFELPMIMELLLKLVFKYWKEIGKHKSRTKELYECREFMKYLDAINFTEADYLIIGKP